MAQYCLPFGHSVPGLGLAGAERPGSAGPGGVSSATCRRVEVAHRPRAWCGRAPGPSLPVLLAVLSSTNSPAAPPDIALPHRDVRALWPAVCSPSRAGESEAVVVPGSRARCARWAQWRCGGCAAALGRVLPRAGGAELWTGRKRVRRMGVVCAVVLATGSACSAGRRLPLGRHVPLVLLRCVLPLARIHE